MIISELIEFLETLPPDSDVMVSIYSCGMISQYKLGKTDIMFDLDQDSLVINTNI